MIMKNVLFFCLLDLRLMPAMRTGRPWTEKSWCESVEEPEWPLAYQKYREQSVETKGRVNSNIQDMRHKCVSYGGESKCHICEDIEESTIHYQLQGVSWEQMAHNIPTVTDSPFAVCIYFFKGYYCFSEFIDESSSRLEVRTASTLGVPKPHTSASCSVGGSVCAQL